MASPYWLSGLKDVTTIVAILIGGGWAAWKWGYGETLRKRREMASPDGTLTAIPLHLEGGLVAVTLQAIWRNRGQLPITLCMEHTQVEVFEINSTPPPGPLRLEGGQNVRLAVTSRAQWSTYIMEPMTDSVMHEHYVLDGRALYGFRWILCLSPGSIPGKHKNEHLICTRELLWSTVDTATPEQTRRSRS